MDEDEYQELKSMLQFSNVPETQEELDVACDSLEYIRDAIEEYPDYLLDIAERKILIMYKHFLGEPPQYHDDVEENLRAYIDELLELFS